MPIEVISLQDRTAIVVDVMRLSSASRVLAPAVAAKEHGLYGLLEPDALFPLCMP
jgi:hypothetical protein